MTTYLIGLIVVLSVVIALVVTSPFPSRRQAVARCKANHPSNTERWQNYGTGNK